jgi:hypothetical protein
MSLWASITKQNSKILRKKMHLETYFSTIRCKLIKLGTRFSVVINCCNRACSEISPPERHVQVKLLKRPSLSDLKPQQFISPSLLPVMRFAPVFAALFLAILNVQPVASRGRTNCQKTKTKTKIKIVSCSSGSCGTRSQGRIELRGALLSGRDGEACRTT